MMRNENMIEPQNPQCVQTRVSGCSCLRCGSVLENKRKKFCSESCKYWFNSIKKDNEKGLPPVKKRNENYFYMIVGSERAKSQSRQGKRSGSMVTGSMSAMVYVTVEEIVELNKENLIRHFKGIQSYTPSYCRLGTMENIKKEEIFNRFGISLE